MKFAIHALLLVLLAMCALAAEKPQKQVIVSYPKDTPDSILEQAKKAVEDAGGVVVHEYHLIKAFVAKASAKTFESVEAMGAQNNVVIEEDKTMSINSS